MQTDDDSLDVLQGYDPQDEEFDDEDDSDLDDEDESDHEIGDDDELDPDEEEAFLDAEASMDCPYCGGVAGCLGGCRSVRKRLSCDDFGD